MEMQPNRLVRDPRKRVENLKTVNMLSGTSNSSMEVDSGSGLRRFVPRLNTSREKEAVDVVFQALLSEANRELANLLRDVSTAGAQNRPIGELLMRAVRCAAKQYMLQAELGNLALTDELTGFYNRRGFQALAERQLKLGRRFGRGMLLFFIDVDGLKQINDSFGHSEGDQALKRTAEALEKTFRDSDVIARLGGDEFAVLAVEATGHSEAIIRARLSEYLETAGVKDCRYAISLSLGVARFDPRSSASLGELMIQADQAMYEQKRRRSTPFVASGANRL